MEVSVPVHVNCIKGINVEVEWSPPMRLSVCQKKVIQLPINIYVVINYNVHRYHAQP